MNVRTHRLELGLTQEAFAERCGLHRTYIGSIERGADAERAGTAALTGAYAA